MRKRTKVLVGLIAIMLLALVSVAVREHAAHRWATLQAIEIIPSGNGCTVSLNVDGMCGYVISRAGSRVLRVGLEGVRASNVLRSSQRHASGLFQDYQISSEKPAGRIPEIQIEIETRSPVRYSIENEGPGLGLAMTPLAIIDALPLDNSATVDALALAPPAGLAASRSAARSRSRLSSVLIRRVAQDRTLVDLNTFGPVQFRTQRLTNPSRLVIDLADATISTGQKFYSVRGDSVKEIRLAEHIGNGTKMARVVADLAGNPEVAVHSAANGVEIELTATETPGAPKPAAAEASVAQARSEYEKQTLAMLMRPVKVSLEDEPPLRPSIPPGDVIPANAGISARALDADVSSPSHENNGLDVAAGGWKSSARRSGTHETVGQNPKSAVARRTRVEADEPNLTQAPLEFMDTLPVRKDWENVDSAPYADSPSILPTALAAIKAAQVVAGQGAHPAPMVVNAAAPAKTKTPTQYTGALISLNLKNVDLKDFFRLIHEISGLNVVVDSNVSGTVTLVLDDVPWDEALDIVLKNNALGKQLEGNVLRIAKFSTLTAEEENTTKLREAQELAAPLVEVYRPLRYAQAIDTKSVTQVQGFTQPLAIPGVVTILKGFAPGSVLSTRGSVVADPRNNAVIITDVPAQIPVIEAVIDKLDRKPKQISIEARIVQANADFSRQLSSVLAAAFKNEVTSTSAATGTNILSVAPPQSPLPGLTSALQPLSVGNSGFGAFAITNASARYAISAALSAAETRDQAKIISRPTIVTQNNVAASVQQGVQIPIQTSINNTITVQFVNATLQLSVIPQVTPGGKIFLNIVVNNASVGAVLSTAGPSINTQQATTQVLVPDGGTVVFGGITVTNRNRNATYVPLLGSIPIIGNLFKSSAVNTNDQELLFFVSPKILPDNS